MLNVLAPPPPHLLTLPNQSFELLSYFYLKLFLQIRVPYVLTQEMEFFSTLICLNFKVISVSWTLSFYYSI